MNLMIQGSKMLEVGIGTCKFVLFHTVLMLHLASQHQVWHLLPMDQVH